MTTATMGTAVPEIKWVTAEEAKTLDRAMLRNYVKRGADGKPTGDFKNFFFKIIGGHKYQPGAVGKDDPMGNADQFLWMFEVQKYHRHQFRKVKVKNGLADSPIEVEQNMAVEKWIMSEDGGGYVEADPEGQFCRDARKFLNEFMPDPIQDE